MSESRVSATEFIVPFAIALVGWGVVFFALDYVIMGLQGLSLFFTPPA